MLSSALDIPLLDAVMLWHIPGVEDAAATALPAVIASWFTISWMGIFCVLWLHRYLRLIVHCISHWSYRSKPIPAKPSYTADDVTVVIPTIHDAEKMEELRPSLESILATKPHELILVTAADTAGAMSETKVEKRFEALKKLADSLSKTQNCPKITVLCTEYANKRIQVCEALPKVTTDITIMADDDVTWPSTMMGWILAPFEDARIGGVGTCQRVRRIRTGDLATRTWNWLGAAYIERRNFEISATHNMDGGTSCMSGRTGAYRTNILQHHEFMDGFMNEKWRGNILKADDDNFVSRWLVRRGWKTWIQYERECELETTLENNPVFLYQCLRWARSNWRSNWTSLVIERFVWRQQPWCTYALHFATFTSLAFVFDFLILAALWWGTADWDPVSRSYAFWAQVVFLGFTKVVKLMGLFIRHPRDVFFLPVSIVFGYFHGLIKLYALFTLNMTSWGSRTDGDTDNKHRLAPWPERSASLNTPPNKHKLPHYEEREEPAEKTPLVE